MHSFLCLFTVWEALRHELLIILRKESHSKGNMATCGLQMEALSLTYCTQTRSRNCHLPLQDITAASCKTKQDVSEPKHLLLPDVSAPQLLCHLILSVSRSDMPTSPTQFHSDGWQRYWHLPNDLVLQGFNSRSSIVNCGVVREDCSHTLTHLQLWTGCWDIIGQSEEDWCLLCEFSSANSAHPFIDVVCQQWVLGSRGTLMH